MYADLAVEQIAMQFEAPGGEQNGFWFTGEITDFLPDTMQFRAFFPGQSADRGRKLTKAFSAEDKTEEVVELCSGEDDGSWFLLAVNDGAKQAPESDVKSQDGVVSMAKSNIDEGRSTAFKSDSGLSIGNTSAEDPKPALIKPPKSIVSKPVPPSMSNGVLA